VLIDILRCHGNNDFKIPHVGKAALERQGKLPSQWTCPADVKNAAASLLVSSDAATYEAAMMGEVKQDQDLVNLCSAFEDAGIVADPELALDDGGNLDDDRVAPLVEEDLFRGEDDSYEVWMI